nr:MAG: RNA-dependent RNA polymerase [Sanya bunya-like virus 11]
MVSLFIPRTHGSKYLLGLVNDHPVLTTIRPESFRDGEMELSLDAEPLMATYYTPSYLAEESFELVDLQGTGDCLIRCLNHVLDEPVNISSVYTALDLPFGTYLEDTHLALLAPSLNVNIHVVVPLNAQLIEACYSTDAETDIYLYNDFPNHYYVMAFNWEEGVENELATETNGRFLPPRPSVELLIDYLTNSPTLSFTSIQQTLEAYAIVHHEFLLTCYELQDNNRTFHSDVFKLYYKFRHNVFAFLCNFSRFHITSFETDMPLSKYIDSKKTPDYITETEDQIEIIEYTVSNTYERADYYKGGGSYRQKYDLERKLVSEKTGKFVKLTICMAVLNEQNVEEIMHCMGIDISEPLFTFFAIANNERELLNTMQVRSYRSHDLKPLKTDLPTYERPSSFRTVMISASLLAQLVDHVKNFHRFAPAILAKSSRRNIILIIDLELETFSYDYKKKKGKWGVSPSEYCEKVRLKGYSYMISVAKPVRNGRPSSWKGSNGMIPVTVPTSEKYIFVPLKPPVRVNPDLYSNTQGLTKEFQHLKSPFIEMKNDLPVYFPPNYHEALSTHSFDNILKSKSKKMLANCTFTVQDLNECIELFNKQYKESNELTSMIVSPKPSFLLPMLSSPQKQAGIPRMFELILPLVTHYTKVIIEKASQGIFMRTKADRKQDPELNTLRDKLSQASGDYFKALGRTVGYKSYKLMNRAERMAVKDEYTQLTVCRKQYADYLSTIKSNVQPHLVHIKCSKRTKIHKDFKSEMKHFSANKGVYSGNGITRDYESVDLLIKGFLAGLSEGVGIEDEPIMNTFRLPGPKLLTELKNMYTNRASEFFDRHFHKKNIDFICRVYRDISTHIFNESTKTYNSSCVKVENLGYENLLILVRGGPKIYRNQTSKLFRIFCIVSPSWCELSGYRSNPNFLVKDLPEGVLVGTPWSILHQDVLFDYMTIRERTFMSMYSASTRINPDISAPVRNLVKLPFLLSLHNRRKTEKFMHNSRYLIVNPLAKHTNVQGIIGSFAGFNYTKIDFWLRERLSRGYHSFASRLITVRNLSNLKIDAVLQSGGMEDLWLEEPLSNADQLTSFIYVTYMMTKAPVNSSLEQASNLWEILEDVKEFGSVHPDVRGLSDHSMRFNILTDGDEVYDDDFKYDPVFSNYLGFHLASFLKNLVNPVELENKWHQLKNQDLSEIANSNGLRGNTKENFFNKKGYEVVFDYIDSQFEDDALLNMVEGYLQADLFSATTNINSDKIKFKPEKQLLFHIVHKIQRGGGREIFCMDINTKSRQNPLEMFFKSICKKIPNEYISIPSNSRHAKIHSDFYDRKVHSIFKQTYRWVLDCRRWAPHSVFQKFVYFCDGMAHLLPADFIQTFREFSEDMYEKFFITREHVYNKIKNNKRFEAFDGLLNVSNTIAGAYTMAVPFSFVMGIFNYLSTMMHAANQIVASEVIRDQCSYRGLGLVLLDPKCHSDDSVVTSYHEKPDSIGFSLKMYDWLLKGANHMLSIKKSQVNQDVYLEFLSILYMFDRFLPVMPKFASTLPFKPSDKGYSADISFAITQAIETVSQGGTYEEAFLIMKLTERFIQKVYRLNYVKALPYNLLGSIDSHPVELLLSGGMSDAYRSMKYSPDVFWGAYNTLSDLKLVKPETAEVSLQWDMAARIRGGPRKIRDKYNEVMMKLPDDIRWTVNNLKLGNGALNLLWYSSRLSDKMFFSSLVDEPVARRYARIFGAGGYRTVVSSEGKHFDVARLGIALDQVIDDIVDKDPVESVFSFYEFCCNDLKHFYESIEGATVGEISESGVKEKPIIFKTGAATMGGVKISAAEFVSYEREPNGYKLLGRYKNPFRDVEMVKKYLSILGFGITSLSNDQLYAAARRVLKDEQKMYRLVMPMPGDNRVVDSYSSMLNTICHNSIKWKKVSIKATNAGIVDWKRKLVGGNIPEAVTAYVEMNWFKTLCQKNHVLDKDIFKVDLADYEKELTDSLPDEWKPVVAVEAEPDDPLIRIPYWSCWVEEQVKVGYQWFGKGKCLVNLPEAFLTINVVSGHINEIVVSRTQNVALSTASTWYLSLFLMNSGMSVNTVIGDFGEPNTNYLIMDNNNNMFRIGTPRGTDTVFVDTIVSQQPLPQLVLSTGTRVSHPGYDMFSFNDRSYKIEYFIPKGDTVTIDLKKFINVEKLKEASWEDDDINNFITDYASGLMGYSRKDLGFLKQHLDSTLIYNVIYQSSGFPNLVSGEIQEDYLLNSLFEWKKTHSGFGFPSEEELLKLAIKENVAPLPPRIMSYLNKLKNHNVGILEFDSAITRMLASAPDDRERTLLSMFPMLSQGSRGQALVLMVRSDRIFTSCQTTGKMKYNIFCEITQLVHSAIIASGITSETLRTIKLNLQGDHNYTEADIWRLAAARYLLDARISYSSYAKEYKSFRVLLTSLKEMIRGGLKIWLNLESNSFAIMKSVEFQVSEDLILNWFTDLADNISLPTMDINPCIDYNRRMLVGQAIGKKKAGLLYNDAGWLLKTLQTIDPENAEPFLEVEMHQKKRKGKPIPSKFRTPNWEELERAEELIPGRIDCGACVLTEDFQEEMEMWEMDDDYDEYEIDSEGEQEEFAFIQEQSLTQKEIKRSRGTARNIFYSVKRANRNITEVVGKWYVYKPENPPGGLKAYLSDQRFLLYLSHDRKPPKVKNYSLLSWERATKELFRPDDEYVTYYNMGGEEVAKLEVVSEPALLAKLASLDQYFLRASNIEVMKEAEVFHQVAEIAEANMALSQDAEQVVIEFKNFYREEKRKSEEQNQTVEQPEEPENNQARIEQMHSMLAVLLEKLKDMESGIEINLIKSTMTDRQLKFRDTLNLLTDERFNSEFNALFADSFKLIMNNEISLTQSEKDDRLLLARSKISLMTGQDKVNHTMLYYIVSTVLGSIKDLGYTDHKSAAFCLKIDSLFKVDQNLTGGDLAPLYSIIAKPPMIIPEDISFLE